MKILSLRGTNLASIPWFEIHLDKGVLSGTRIFAITGPTGAGKSTLLDAISLALYDRAPRLIGARDIGSDQQDVRGADPRAVMRRHSSEAAAEIDFVGQDGVRYRATWEVWRAHRRASGRVQSQRMTLRELDSGRDISGATKTETMALIEQRVGLSFDEFRRAVLLAQGDFAAFLEARPDERAELLEKMTGTHIYADLSRAAYQRAKEQAATLEALMVRRDAVVVLSVEDRAELEAQREALLTQKLAVEATLKAAEVEVSWHERHQTLIDEQSAAEARRAAAHEAWTNAAHHRKQLAERVEAERLAPAYQMLADATERASAAKTALEAAAREADAAAVVAHDAANAMAAAARAATAIKDVMASAATDVERARTLDTKLVDARDEAARAQGAFDAAHLAWSQAAVALESHREDVERATAHAESLGGWLGQHTELQAVARTWSRWETVLAEAIEIQHELEAEVSRATPYAAALETARANKKTKGAAFEHAQKQHDEKRARLDDVIGQIDAHRAVGTDQDIADAREIVARRIGDIARLESVPRETKKLEKDLSDALAKVEAEEGLARLKKAERKHARHTAKKLEVKKDQAELEYEEAEAVRTVSSRRAELLTQGEACPLCGSTNHPYGDGGPTPKKAVRLKRKLRKIQAELERVKATAAASKEHDGMHAERAREARARAELAQAEIAERNTEWAMKREALELVWTESRILAGRGLRRLALELPDTPEQRRAAKAATSVREALEAHLVALEKLGGRSAKLSTELDSARAAFDRSAATLQELRQVVDVAEVNRAKAEAELARTNERIEERRQRQRTLGRQLELEEGHRWLVALVEDPLALSTEMKAQVATLEAKLQERSAAVAATEEAGKKRLLAQSKHDGLLEARRTAESAMTQRTAALTVLAKERDTLLDGMTVEAFVVTNEAAREQAQTRLAERRTDADAATKAETTAVANREALRRAYNAAESDCAQRKAQLEAMLVATSFESAAALAECLALSPEQVAALEEEKATLGEETTRADATALDSTQRLLKHRETALAGDAESARERRRTARATRDAVVERTARTEEKIKADEAAKTTLAALGPNIEAHRDAADHWAEINDVIGSADGKKLRTFAQGLTLEVLLEQANLHLAQLRPRYRLRRVQATDMELEVIDADMADEVRAVSTLSGGERFLVSLALALGLSSLSSRNVKIESLFIDEGFGSLDRDTLEVALSTLDQLQSEGRTIGIISHMPEIAERIGYQIEVRPVGPGRSEVRVLGT